MDPRDALSRRSPPPYTAGVRILPALAAVLLLALLAGGLWLDRLFEEPEAQVVDSLAATLGTRSLLAVFAHPDDEIMAAGALADAAARGVAVHVITATRGEKGTPDVPVSGPDELAEVRERELREHARLLGVRDPVVWRFPDREVDRNLDEATARLRSEIARIRPDTVLTFHPRTGYTDHEDHKAIGTAATRAVAASQPSPALVYLVAPRGVMRVLGGERGERIAALQPAPTWAVPVNRELKARGWRIHASQAGYIRRSWKVTPGFLYLWFDQEHYLRAAPPGP